MAAVPAAAGGLQVVTTYGYIGSIVGKIGGSNVRVYTLARGDYDPHVIIPRPSFIAKVRSADLVVINGAQLEIGWLPPLLRQANNPNVQPGEPGFLDLSRFVTLIEIPVAVSREHGDIHPDGNPHFNLDPENIPPLARAIRDRLSQLDPGGAESYRTNCAEFERAWSARLGEWAGKMEHLKNVRVVEYHKIFDYLLRRYNLTLAGTVEPQPGIPPTSKHVERLEALLGASPARYILQDVYNPDDASRHLAEKLGVQLVVVPHDVGSVAEAGDIFALFDEIVRRLTQ
jgi:zinc/manganese transport system substrate-binding protein